MEEYLYQFLTIQTQWWSRCRHVVFFSCHRMGMFRVIGIIFCVIDEGSVFVVLWTKNKGVGESWNTFDFLPFTNCIFSELRFPLSDSSCGECTHLCCCRWFGSFCFGAGFHAALLNELADIDAGLKLLPKNDESVFWTFHGGSAEDGGFALLIGT